MIFSVDLSNLRWNDETPWKKSWLAETWDFFYAENTMAGSLDGYALGNTGVIKLPTQTMHLYKGIPSK